MAEVSRGLRKPFSQPHGEERMRGGKAPREGLLTHFLLPVVRPAQGPQPTRFFVKDTKGRSEQCSQVPKTVPGKVSLFAPTVYPQPCLVGTGPVLGGLWGSPSGSWLCHGYGEPITSSDSSPLGSSWFSLPKPSLPEVGGSLPRKNAEPRLKGEDSRKRDKLHPFSLHHCPNTYHLPN